MNDNLIDSMFLDKQEEKMNKIRTQLILNGVLQPKQINKKKSKRRKKSNKR